MSQALSDFTQTNANVGSNVALIKGYADLDVRLLIHPITHDCVPLTDIVAVKNAVKNLILTNYFEVPFAPFQGGNLRALLFENADSFTATALRNEIRRVIEDHEPRVNFVVVEVTDDSDRNAFNVTVGFNIINLNTQTEVNFYLERLR